LLVQSHLIWFLELYELFFALVPSWLIACFQTQKQNKYPTTAKKDDLALRDDSELSSSNLAASNPTGSPAKGRFGAGDIVCLFSFDALDLHMS
jgi:hypothetical protein